MNVDRRVISFIRANRGNLYCHKCVSFQVSRPGGGHINETQASNAIRPLKDIDEFTIEKSTCSKCGEIKQVVGAM